jgi:hypothetical protein
LFDFRRLQLTPCNLSFSTSLLIRFALLFLFSIIQPQEPWASSLEVRPAVTINQSESSFRLDATGLVTAQASVTYQWTLVSRPGVSTATLTSATSPIAGLDADTAGSYTVELSLNEGASQGRQFL